MLSALFLALVSAPDTLDLVRGAQIRPGYTYWCVEDTYLDASSQDENFGGSLSLLGGPSKVILIRFGDLERAVGVGKRVKSAKLVLTPLTENPQIKGVERLETSWNEGPLHPLLSRLTANPDRWSVTWRNRYSGEGGVPWQSPGANGPADNEPIAGLTSTSTESEYTIDGLGPAIERMRQRWYENDGLAIRFDNTAEFYSSQAQVGRPRLVLELEDAPKADGPDLGVTYIEAKGDTDRTYIAHIKNVGSAPAGGFSASWAVGGKFGATVDQPKPLGPGEETTLPFTHSFKPNDADHRLQPLGLRIVPTGADASASNDYLEIQESGFPVDLNVPAGSEDWAQSVVREWNDVYSTQSRYSFATNGSLERVRINRFSPDATVAVSPSEVGNDAALLRKIGLALGLADLSKAEVPAGSGRVAFTYGSVDPYAGIMGGGDTRYEGAVPPTMWLPYEPRAFEPFDVIPPDPTGLLSATDVAALNANLGKTGPDRKPFAGMPGALILKATDDLGTPLGGTEVNFFQSVNGKISLDAPSFTVTTNDQGIVVMPKREGGLFGSTNVEDGVLLVRAQRNGVPGWAWLKAWQLADAYARGNAQVVITELRFNVPGSPLDTVNLATNRIVTDSANTDPAKLASLVDDDAGTAVDVPGGKDSWVEIDLGRDRTIGEIQILGTPEGFWRKFSVVAYGTGQTAGNAETLCQERDWTYAAQNRSETLDPVRKVLYRTAGERYRFIRILNRTDEPGKLNGIRVIAAKVGQ